MKRQYRVMFWATVLMVGSTMDPSRCQAKERHFEEVRAVLIARSATCITCHVDASGSKLNVYGVGLHELQKDESLGDRILRMESEPRVGATEADRRKQLARQDVDGDGVRNWIEILAGRNPGDKKSKPKRKQVEQIARVISCSICHSDTNLPGKEEGLAANPHNELGALLAKTTQKPRGTTPRSTGDRAIRAAAERLSILTRLTLIKNKKPKRSRATYWQRIRLLFSPTDTTQGPSPEQVKAFRKAAATQRSPRKRDSTKGIDCDAHRLDGFFEDAKGLD